MHDWIDFRARVVVFFALDIVGKKPRDVRVGAVGFRQAGPDRGVDRALLDEVVERLVARTGFQLDRLEQRQHARRAVRALLVDCALHPRHLGKVDAVIVLQDAADEDRRRHRVERNPDALAFKVLGRLDAGPFVDGNEAVPEAARGKHRDGHERALLVGVTLDVFRA